MTARPGTLKHLPFAAALLALPATAVLRAMPVEDPNIGKGYWTGKKYFGIQQTLFFPFGIGIIKDGKNLGVGRQEAIAE